MTIVRKSEKYVLRIVKTKPDYDSHPELGKYKSYKPGTYYLTSEYGDELSSNLSEAHVFTEQNDWHVKLIIRRAETGPQGGWSLFQGKKSMDGEFRSSGGKVTKHPIEIRLIKE